VGHLTLKSLIKKAYDFEPATIGEHVKKKRLQLGLTQNQIAKRLSVCVASVINWENGDHQPADAPTLKRIIQFLGYDPIPTGTTIADLLRAKRRALGMGQRELATHLGADPSTIMLWEQGGTILPHRYRQLIASLLKLPELELREMMRRQLNASQGRRTPSHDRDVIRGIRARHKTANRHRK
jgi:transcriptional regulator with XRE-family HTH domain